MKNVIKKDMGRANFGSPTTLAALRKGDLKHGTTMGSTKRK